MKFFAVLGGVQSVEDVQICFADLGGKDQIQRWQAEEGRFRYALHQLDRFFRSFIGDVFIQSVSQGDDCIAIRLGGAIGSRMEYITTLIDCGGDFFYRFSNLPSLNLYNLNDLFASMARDFRHIILSCISTKIDRSPRLKDKMEVVMVYDYERPLTTLLQYQQDGITVTIDMQDKTIVKANQAGEKIYDMRYPLIGEVWKKVAHDRYPYILRQYLTVPPYPFE